MRVAPIEGSILPKAGMAKKSISFGNSEDIRLHAAYNALGDKYKKIEAVETGKIYLRRTLIGAAAAAFLAYNGVKIYKHFKNEADAEK